MPDRKSSKTPTATTPPVPAPVLAPRAPCPGDIYVQRSADTGRYCAYQIIHAGNTSPRGPGKDIGEMVQPVVAIEQNLPGADIPGRPLGRAIDDGYSEQVFRLDDFLRGEKNGRVFIAVVRAYADFNDVPLLEVFHGGLGSAKK